jgi:formylglycine-generating enzyme required for sulfatase activity/serine/threonine protein kinase
MLERQLFESALEIADTQARQAFLDDACHGDGELRAKVDALLKSHAAAGSFLDIPAADQMGPEADNRTTNTIVGAPGDDSAAERASGEAEFRKYLQPATRTGWLGRLGHYEIEAILGRGAFGIVAKAFDEKLHRVVAIKLMNPELAATSPPRQRFLREARTAAAVTHENIVAIHAVEEEPIPYLVMEYISGQTLQQRMDARGPLETQEILRIGQQVASGLAAAHAAKLIHRDIKPSNILLTDGPHERAKISDFGLARAVDDASMTSSGMIAGTPMYMAPEQARGETLDHRADLFSLGSVLYQTASGRPPFRAANTVAVLKRVCEDTPRPLDDVIPGIPGWLETIIFKLLEKDRDARYQTAQEVADLLARCQGELQHQGRVTCVPGRPTAETQVLPTTKVVRNAPARRPLGWLVGGILALAAVVGFVLINGGKKNSEVSTVQPPVENGTAATPKTPAETPAVGWHGWPGDSPKPAIAPFDAAQARKHQEVWAKYLQIDVEYTNSLGMKFVLIPPGEFVMGSTEDEIAAALQHIQLNDKRRRDCIQSEAPQHRVILTQPIYVGVNEVTQAEFKRVMGSNPSSLATNNGRENHPVDTVSWNDAAEFCVRLSLQEKLKPSYSWSGASITPLEGAGYRLLSEAEWEFACRAGTKSKYWIGDQDQDLIKAGWFGENSGFRTHPVGELRANPFGIYDVHGNVWEWVEDRWDSSFYGRFEKEPAVNPKCGFTKDPLHALRGGNYSGPAFFCRSSDRLAFEPSTRAAFIGFRVSLSVDAVRQAMKRVAMPVEGVRRAIAIPRDAGAVSEGNAGHPGNAPGRAVVPFDAAKAKRHQEAWAKHLNVPVEYTNSIGMKFRLIPPGEFEMGSTPAEIKEAVAQLAGSDPDWIECIKGESPKHRAVLTQPFYLSVAEVTQGAYQRVTGQNPSWFCEAGPGHKEVEGLNTRSFPVERVTWKDAVTFCNSLNRSENVPSKEGPGRSATRNEGGYFLPSEVQWEFASRAGTSTRFSAGDADQNLAATGWYAANAGPRPHSTGELQANPFGIFDMHGNVWEWIHDSWDSYDHFHDKPAVDWVAENEASPRRGIRGGYWYGAAASCRSAGRDAYPMGAGNFVIGFRVALSVDFVSQALVSAEKAGSGPTTLTKTNAHAWPDDAPKPAIAPLDAAQAKTHQDEWAVYLKVPAEYSNSLGMKFRLIPPGQFRVGCPAEEKAEALAIASDSNREAECVRSEVSTRHVVLTRPFYLGATEVTQAEYQKVMGLNPSNFARNGPTPDYAKRVAELDTARFPVEGVAWSDAAEFCAKLSEQERYKPYYSRRGENVTQLDGNGYRLPTEVEWEVACRAGTTSRFWFGDSIEDLEEVAWISRNSAGRTHPVAELKPNPLGLYDVYGNVCEWAHDDWAPSGPASEGAIIDPGEQPHIGAIRIHRGGMWYFDYSLCRSAARITESEPVRSGHIGFRVLLPVDAVRDALTNREPESRK